MVDDGATPEPRAGRPDRLPVDSPREADPGLAPLLRRLTDDGRTLLRQEVALAGLEVRQSVRALVTESALIAVGGLFLVLGLLLLLVFAVLALGRLLGGAYWLSTLIVGGVLTLIGIVVLLVGKRALRENELTPRRTMESVRETKEWAESEAKRLARVHPS